MQAWHLSSVPAVVITAEPKDFASWIAVVPIPLEPPCTNNDSPLARRPRSKTFVHTVKNVSGMAAACALLKPSGTGRHSDAGAAQYSA